MPTSESRRLSRAHRLALAGSALTVGQAKLYSQRTRRRLGQPGLASFTAADIDDNLNDALSLIDTALIERFGTGDDDWRLGVKRAAEILEFLSQGELRPRDAPIQLLAAAAYQVAGYPAMASAHLERVADAESASNLLRAILRADFAHALELVIRFWQAEYATAATPRVETPLELTAAAVRHTVMCIGTVCAGFRFGSSATASRAVLKLLAISTGFHFSQDKYSYLLARLTALACARYVDVSMWEHLRPLLLNADDGAKQAMTQFARAAFLSGRMLVWPTQAAGMKRLETGESFVLCTPTGSGKTSVATLAIVQALFTTPTRPAGLENLEVDNLVLYVVPSRALAAEVEAKLSQDLRGVAVRPVVVTGLYGGVDWGPTDAWVQTDGPTILICTFEKADALIRYLGVLFLHRVRLVVIDEAHMVNQNASGRHASASGDSRALRVESLVARLLSARDRYQFRIVALSAVAAGAAPALARWIGTDDQAVPAVADYRSTRQMLGRLDVASDARFAIRYHLMNGQSLQFRQGARESPYVQMPFPPMPGGLAPGAGPEKVLEGPTLWAALHLAARGADGTAGSVLISVTQRAETFAWGCAKHLAAWQQSTLPDYRDEVGHLPEWQRCLASAADYFGTESVEYRMLQLGVAVHHGKMPGLLARRLKRLIDRGRVRVVIATSTLSEGVNIPITHLLIPSVYRGTDLLSAQEFTNLIGRVGRPGVATEGHALVVLPGPGVGNVFSRQRDGFAKLVAAVRQDAATRHMVADDGAESPLAQLLAALEAAWRRLVRAGTSSDFMTWLAETAVTPEETSEAVGHLDVLDQFLLGAIQEVEELDLEEIPGSEMESKLTQIWRRTYASAASREEEHLRQMWLQRGGAIKRLYPNAATRRQIYRTSLSPRSAFQLLAVADVATNTLREGAVYAELDQERRFAFIVSVIEVLSRVTAFQVPATLGTGKSAPDWRQVLRWWMAKSTLQRQPSPKQVTKWFHFASQNFIFRASWGLGSVIGLFLEGSDGEPVRALEIDDWPRSGLPWIAFWLKELIAWGTLEPVAAYLMARGDAVDRPEAELNAMDYYRQLPPGLDANDMLDPRRIRAWSRERGRSGEAVAPQPGVVMTVALARPTEQYRDEGLQVFAIGSGGTIQWIDPAGYLVAQGARPEHWPADPLKYSFTLDVAAAVVTGEPYLTHAT